MATNPLVWCDRHRRQVPRALGREILMLFAMLIAWSQIVRFLPTGQAGAVFPDFIWATLVVVLAGSAASSMRRMDDDRRRNRLEVLWSTPVLQEALLGSVQRDSLRWFLRSMLWMFGLLWTMWTGNLPAAAALVALSVSIAILGGWVGTATALATARGPLRWMAVAAAGVLGVLGPAGIDVAWHDQSITALATVGLVTMLLAISRRALQPLLASSMPSVWHGEKVLRISILYRALDCVLMVLMRRLKLQDNAIFRLQRARALRRFSRQPLWFLLALVPAAAPLLAMGLFHATLQTALVVLSVVLCFSWWMAGAGATQDSLRTILDSQTMVTLRLTPFDTRQDSMALIWGRLYTLALAWLIGLPLWVAYASMSDTPLAVLLLPVVCAVLCFMSSLGGVRAACVNLVRNYEGDRRFYSEGAGNVAIWAWALLASPILTFMANEHSSHAAYIPVDMISGLTVALGWPLWWSAWMLVPALLIHAFVLELAFAIDIAAVQEALGTALNRE